MSRRDWLCPVVAWDGFFPLLVAAAPAMLSVALPKGVLAGLTVFLAPIVAALLRAHQGCRRLNEGGCGATLGRQLLLGCAIIALLLFEGLAGVLLYAVGAPRSLWWTAGGIYLGYLGLILAALRPQDRRQTTMTSPIPSELLATLAELGRLYPSMRFGQLLELVALLSSADVLQSPSSVPDERLLQAAVTHLLKRLKQLGVERGSLLQTPIPAVRNDLLQVLQELHNQHPDWQIGQLVANLAEQSGTSFYDAEDEDLLAAGQQHLGGAPA